MISDLNESITVAGDNLTLSLIVWRRYKRPVFGLVEATLDRNPGLAELGPILPVGTVFDLPVVIDDPEPKLPSIKLW